MLGHAVAPAPSAISYHLCRVHCALVPPDRGCRAALPTSSGQAGCPCTGSGSLTSMSPLAAPDPAVMRPAEFSWRLLASRKILGTGTHTTLRIANIFQDLLLPGTTRRCLMGQAGRKLLTGQLRPGPGTRQAPGLPRLAPRTGPGPVNRGGRMPGSRIELARPARKLGDTPESGGNNAP
jgi:hypothetical protein